MAETLGLVLGGLERLYRRWHTLVLRLTKRDKYGLCLCLGAYHGENRVKFFIDTDKTGEMQRYRVCKEHSPGPVVNREILARWVFTPPHVTKPLPGELNDSFFDGVLDNGLSVQRIHCRWRVARRDIHSRGEAQVANDGRVREDGTVRAQRKYLGVVKFATGALRHLLVEHGGERGGLRVYDTALPGDPGHAEVMADVRGSTKTIQKILRQQLRVQLMNLAVTSGIYRPPDLPRDDADLVALGIDVRE